MDTRFVVIGGHAFGLVNGEILESCDPENPDWYDADLVDNRGAGGQPFVRGMHQILTILNSLDDGIDS